ncbi:MAG: Hpt domain-containing protein [Bryobacteraceae bacterium]
MPSNSGGDGSPSPSVLYGASRLLENKHVAPCAPIVDDNATSREILTTLTPSSVFVSKPISPEGLRPALGKWLGTGEHESAPGAGEIVPSQAAVDEPAVFDRAGLVKRMMGNRALATSVVAAFLLDIPCQIQALKDLLEKGDAPGFGRRAHSIKGAAATVGGECLRKVALEMEKAADAGDLGAVACWMAELEAQFFRLKDAMARPGDAEVAPAGDFG